ncbi:MAG: hypothetical protein OEQ28_01065 [Acidobacteriota bacterium]|nr:hypothetical protein [Acidobacteriota bacterium]
MKTWSEKRGLAALEKLRKNFSRRIRAAYEFRAKDCLTCDVQGSCCTDAHFVNVHISKLAAVAIRDALAALDPTVRERVIRRNKHAVESLQSDFASTYSCPLFEKGVGCLVHQTAKPLPCINHACYENASDLPPSAILKSFEMKIGRLNDSVYRKNWNWLPIPVWLHRVLSR